MVRVAISDVDVDKVAATQVRDAVAAFLQEDKEDDVTCYLSQTFWKPALQVRGHFHLNILKMQSFQVVKVV